MQHFPDSPFHRDGVWANSFTQSSGTLPLGSPTTSRVSQGVDLGGNVSPKPLGTAVKQMLATAREHFCISTETHVWVSRQVTGVPGHRDV